MNRPRINKHRRQKKPFVYKPLTTPLRSIARGTIIKGLFEEIECSNSTIKLYALLTIKAILSDCDRRMQERYGLKLKQMADADPNE